MLSFNVEKQLLTRIDNNTVVSGSENYLYAMFEFSYDWDNSNVSAIYYSDNKLIKKTSVVTNGVTLVPFDMINYPYFYVSLVGSNGAIKITTNEVLIRVESPQEIVPTSPQPDWYSNLLRLLGLKQNILENTLLTNNKTIPSAINELFGMSKKSNLPFRIFGGNPKTKKYMYKVDGGYPDSIHTNIVVGGNPKDNIL